MKSYSDTCLAVLALLKTRKNVLLSGPPATGKSTLLNEVAHAFKHHQVSTVSVAEKPVLVPSAAVPIPAMPEKAEPSALEKSMPSGSRTIREVFPTVFHQNMKYRDFVTGLTPSVGKPGEFQMMQGSLYRANEFAKQPGAAALLIIDEINRGPAVQIFGGAIVAIEGDKRLDHTGTPAASTQWFELHDPATNTMIPYAFAHDLYILAAMNQADVSVDALDVAFLRRWAPFKLAPSEQLLREHLGLGHASSLPDTPSQPSHVYEALVQAWKGMNARLVLGRGPEFQMGHGLIMAIVKEPQTDVSGALADSLFVWEAIFSHIEEVFFADVRGLAAVLNAGEDASPDGFALTNETFAGEPKHMLATPLTISGQNMYAILKSII
jgi:5-methylcytosine-specific restriction protein B